MEECIDISHNEKVNDSLAYSVIEEILNEFDSSKGLEEFVLEFYPEYKDIIEEYKIIYQSFICPIVERTKGKLWVIGASTANIIGGLIENLDNAIKHHETNTIIQIIDYLLHYFRVFAQTLTSIMNELKMNELIPEPIYKLIYDRSITLKKAIIGIRMIVLRSKKISSTENDKEIIRIDNLLESNVLNNFCDNEDFTDTIENYDTSLKCGILYSPYIEFADDGEMLSFLDDLIEQEPVLYKYYSIKDLTLNLTQSEAVHVDYNLVNIEFSSINTKSISEYNTGDEQMYPQLINQNATSAPQIENFGQQVSSNSNSESEKDMTQRLNTIIKREMPINDQKTQSYCRNFSDDVVRYLYDLLVDKGYITELNDNTYELFYARINGMKSKDFDFNPKNKIKWKKGEEALREFFFISYTIFEKNFTKAKDFFEFPTVDTKILDTKTKDAVRFITKKSSDLSNATKLTTDFIEYLNKKGHHTIADSINNKLKEITRKTE